MVEYGCEKYDIVLPNIELYNIPDDIPVFLKGSPTKCRDVAFDNRIEYLPFIKEYLAALYFSDAFRYYQYLRSYVPPGYEERGYKPSLWFKYYHPYDHFFDYALFDFI